ncbi:MAG: hypothetical protein AMJ60_05905 [Desulfobacterales bacterium SG8_35]|nr:MAG: hypothetical protein AMJ60_05905 [Desulfobacterales bacterium SG8_35]
MKTIAKTIRLRTKKIRTMADSVGRLVNPGQSKPDLSWWKNGKISTVDYLKKDMAITANSQRPVSAPPNSKTPSAILLILACI